MELKTPKVSIIIPVYNVEDYLREALDSAINQTLKEIEIICIDDCSTDNSLAILKEYAEKDNRFVILEQKVNQGQGIGRNRALDIAKGECIMFLDPDDWYEPDACEKAYKQLTKNNNDYVYMNYCSYKQFDKKPVYVSGDYHLRSLFENLGNPDIKLWELHNNFWINANTHCRAYKRSFLNRYHIRYDETIRLCEDVPFFAKCIANAKSVSVILDELYNFRDRKGSTSKDFKIYEGSLISRKTSYEIIKNSEHSKELMLPFLYYATTVLSHYNHLCDINTKIEKEFYNKIREFFIFLDKNEDIELIKNYKEQYNKFKSIVKTPYYCYKMKKILSKIFNINVFPQGEIYRINISFLGTSLRLKLKNNNLPVQNPKKILERIQTVRIQKNKPINVIFLSDDAKKWKYTNLYNKFKESGKFNPKVVTLPTLEAHRNKDNTGLKSLTEYHKNQGFEVACAYNTDKHFYRSTMRYCPDIIFYEQVLNMPRKFEINTNCDDALIFWTSDDNKLQNLFKKNNPKKALGEKITELSKEEADKIYEDISNLVLNFGENNAKTK